MPLQFQPGDIVRVKSGGPDMTVSSASRSQSDSSNCVWFDDKGEVKNQAFKDAVLEKVDTASGSGT